MINMEIKEGTKEKSKGKEKGTKVKVTKDKVTKSFGELIKDYQKEGYSDRESIERAYSKMYNDDSKVKKTPKKKKDKKGEVENEGNQ